MYSVYYSFLQNNKKSVNLVLNYHVHSFSTTTYNAIKYIIHAWNTLEPILDHCIKFTT